MTTCTGCADTGHVCENHPTAPGGGMCCGDPAVQIERSIGGRRLCEHGACHCGAGRPCAQCCDCDLEEGRHLIGEAFVPRRDVDLAVTIHQCPPGDSGVMPCCGRTPFELPSDRMTSDPSLVTCEGR